jgi:hypothetical protein
MKADINASVLHGARPSVSAKLVACPFEVRIDGAFHDHFYDVRDAIASARNAQREHLGSTIVVTDIKTKKLVIQIDT